MFGATTALQEKDKEIRQLQKDHDADLAHKYEIDQLKLVQREETKELRQEIEELKAAYERCENKATNSANQLGYERDNRKVLIDAEVQKTLGQYETRYYHDLHTFMETHNEKFNTFQQTFMDKTLAVIKEMKPNEAKVMILGKEVFGADAKAQQNEKKNS